MDIQKLFRLFKTGAVKKKTSVYLHTPIVKGLEELSNKTGESISDIVADALDQYLTKCAQANLISTPTKDKETNSVKAQGA